jgi:hypothetical protein
MQDACSFLRFPCFFTASWLSLAALTVPAAAVGQSSPAHNPADDFRTAAHCATCHTNMKSAKGENASIVGDWRASVMANAARDPYWQGSVRRETLDHPQASAAIQTECATCHMPLEFLADKAEGHGTDVFKRLPLRAGDPDDGAADGVSCTVCHQIQSAGLGTAATYSGSFNVAAPGTEPRPIFGPFESAVTIGKIHAVSTGYTTVESAHIRDAGLCGSCHTLYTTTLGADGKPAGRFPEQMPYLEWLHSDYHDKQTCQQCHMPAVEGQTAIASIMGQPRDGVRLHTFVGANFVLDNMLAAHHDDLAVAAEPAALSAAAAQTTAFLQSQAAQVEIIPAKMESGELAFAVLVKNLTGHKLPTAYPSRRAWLHVTVTGADGRVVFESGKLNADGSIAGNANDADATRYSPHYTLITKPDEVEIFEPILGDSQGHVTTALLSTTQYLKDNRILPAGFDKQTAPVDVAVHGKAADDPDFAAGSCVTHYKIAAGAAGPWQIAAELLYQPIGYRWAHNLAPYQADETQRFTHYYEDAATHSAVVLAHAETTSAGL